MTYFWKSRRFLLLLCACYLLLPAGSIWAQSLDSRVSTDSLTIGETFEYALILQMDQEYERIQFPDTNAFPPSLELLNRQQFKLSEFSDSLIYSFQYFGNEDLQIPPMPVTLYSADDSTTLFSEPVALFFKTVVARGDTTLKPMKPNFTFGRMWWPWILAALLLSAALVWWFYFREEKEAEIEEPEKEIKPFYDPLKELEKTLQSLKDNSALAQNRDFKSFYSTLGDAIRRYFEDLYRIPALESTTSELLRFLEAYGVDDDLTEATRKVLRKADLVKFAKFTPTLDDAWNTHEEALVFLKRAKLADASRISRLKAEYNEQFILSTNPQKDESDKREDA